MVKIKPGCSANPRQFLLERGKIAFRNFEVAAGVDRTEPSDARHGRSRARSLALASPSFGLLLGGSRHRINGSGNGVADTSIALGSSGEPLSAAANASRRSRRYNRARRRRGSRRNGGAWHPEPQQLRRTNDDIRQGRSALPFRQKGFQRRHRHAAPLETNRSGSRKTAFLRPWARPDQYRVRGDISKYLRKCSL